MLAKTIAKSSAYAVRRAKSTKERTRSERGKGINAECKDAAAHGASLLDTARNMYRADHLPCEDEEPLAIRIQMCDETRHASRKPKPGEGLHPSPAQRRKRVRKVEERNRGAAKADRGGGQHGRLHPEDVVNELPARDESPMLPDHSPGGSSRPKAITLGKMSVSVGGRVAAQAALPVLAGRPWARTPSCSSERRAEGPRNRPCIRLGLPQPKHERPAAFNHDMHNLRAHREQPPSTRMTTPPPLEPPAAVLKAMKLPGMVAKSPCMPSGSCRHNTSCTSANASICFHFALRLPVSPAIVPKKGAEIHVQTASGTNPTHGWAHNDSVPGGPRAPLPTDSAAESVMPPGVCLRPVEHAVDDGSPIRGGRILFSDTAAWRR